MITRSAAWKISLPSDTPALALELHEVADILEELGISPDLVSKMRTGAKAMSVEGWH